MASNTFVGRMIGAAMLDIETYEAVEHDTTLTSQAAAVVVLAAIATGIATEATVIGGAVGGLLGWFAMAGTIYFIGTRLFGGTATWGELLRTLGFAASPKILMVVAILPLVGWAVELAVGIWSLAAAVVAIRQALDVSTGKAILSGLLGILFWWFIAGVIAALFVAG